MAGPSSTAILSSTGLTSAEQTVEPDNQPDVYRVLSVKGNDLGMDQAVHIIGTDFGGNRIVEKISLFGLTEQKGHKPFQTVTKIILPAQHGSGETVSVGTTSKLGLQFPIATTADVLQQGRKASGAGSYTMESSGWTPEATYATVDIASITAGDSFEWAVLASQ